MAKVRGLRVWMAAVSRNRGRERKSRHGWAEKHLQWEDFLFPGMGQ